MNTPSPEEQALIALIKRRREALSAPQETPSSMEWPELPYREISPVIADSAPDAPGELSATAFNIPAMPVVAGVEFPATPDSIHKIAYELLPIWVSQFGHAYGVRPSTILKAWIQSLNEGDERGGVDPWILQHVVWEMSVNGEVFNPRNMSAVAARVRKAMPEGVYSALQLEWTQRPRFEYDYFTDIAPVVRKASAPDSTTTQHSQFPVDPHADGAWIGSL